MSFFDHDVISEIDLPASDVISQIGPQLTHERFDKIRKVVAGRTLNVGLILERLYDRGNISAVIRSAEAYGICQIHNIELSDKFKESQRTTAGADKWVEVKKWKSTEECVRNLKSQGYQIVATHLDATAVDISQIDFTKKTMLVLGNEKDGISPEMQKLADQRVILPMVGFVQSFNISVAAAISLYHIYTDRIRRQGFHGDLTDKQKENMIAEYILRTQDSAMDQMKLYKERLKQ